MRIRFDKNQKRILHLNGVKRETFYSSIVGVTSDILWMFADVSFATDERRKKHERRLKKCNVSSSKNQAKTSEER